MTEPRCVALNFTYHANYIDHLAPLCFVMQMPLLLVEKKQQQQMQKYFPQIETQLFVDYTKINYLDLTKQYDLFFQTTLENNALTKFFAKSINKKICHVYLPHGNSDKGHRTSYFLQGLVFQDMCLVYGDHMIDRIKRVGLWDTCPPCVKIGNYRLQFYRQFQTFYKQIVEEEVFSRFAKQQKTLLYAPSWQDPEQSTSFFTMAKKIIEQLPDDWNLLVKCHPLLEEKHPHLYYSLISHFENRKNVVVLLDYPLIYPLLDKADVFLGDFSSVGYDFLSFHKPMFFFDLWEQKNDNDPSYQLHRVGRQIPISYHNKIYDFIENHWDTKLVDKQKKLYKLAFGEEISFTQLREDVLLAFQKI